MPFAPATQFLFDQYGQNTGVDDERRHHGPTPRYARPRPTPQPEAVDYAPNSPTAGLYSPEPEQPANAPPPQVMKQLESPVVGPRSATLGDPGQLPWPRMGLDYFDDDRRRY